MQGAVSRADAPLASRSRAKATRRGSRTAAPAEQRERQERRDAFVTVVAAAQRLSSPRPSVRPAARSVPGQAQDLVIPRQAGLSHDGGDVGMVVLDLDHRKILPPCPEGRPVPGVGVAGYHDGGYAEEAGEFLRLALEGVDAAGRLQVSDVGAQGDGVPGAHGHGALQLSSRGQDGREREGGRKGSGGHAPGPPKQDFAVSRESDHRVVDAPQDGPVMQQYAVRHASDELPILREAVENGVSRGVPARADHRLSDLAHHEGMEGRGGQHGADPGQAHGHPVGCGGFGPDGQDHDGPAGVGEGDFRGPIQYGPPPDPRRGINLGRGEHHREGPGLPALADAEGGHGPFVGRVADEYVTAQAQQAEDAPLPNHACRSPNGCFSVDAGSLALEPGLGTACGAGGRLRMVSAVFGRVVFGPACRAEGKAGQGRPLPVPGQRLQDAVARAAAGAGEEGVAPPPVHRVQGFRHAGVAGGQVWEEPGSKPPVRRVAFRDAECRVSPGLSLPYMDGFQGCRLRRLRLQGPVQGCDGPLRPFGLDDHTPSGVSDPSREVLPSGDARDEGTKADSLYDSRNFDSDPHHHSMGSGLLRCKEDDVRLLTGKRKRYRMAPAYRNGPGGGIPGIHATDPRR